MLLDILALLLEIKIYIYIHIYILSEFYLLNGTNRVKFKLIKIR